MSIEIKSNEILGLCKKLSELRKNQIRASDYTSIKNDLEDIVGRIEPISKTVIALATELENKPVPNAPVHAAELIDAALTIVNGDDLELAAMDLPKFRSIFNALRDQLKTRAENDWSTIIKKRHVPWPEDLLGGLETIGFFQEVQQLKRYADDVADSIQNLPKSTKDIEIFTNFAKSYQDATERINLPPYMKEFLRNAVHGLPLNSLTDEVKSWLEKNQLLNKFAIKFAR